jgi:hypothetical protein
MRALKNILVDEKITQFSVEKNNYNVFCKKKKKTVRVPKVTQKSRIGDKKKVD